MLLVRRRGSNINPLNSDKMSSKKTINVDEMKTWSNFQLKRTDEYATLEFKSGICCMIEKILMMSDNYKGYMELPNQIEFSRVYS